MILTDRLQIHSRSYSPRLYGIAMILRCIRLIGLLVFGFANANANGIAFDTLLSELQVAADAKTVTTTFRFSNRGGKPSTIRKYRASCACMTTSIAHDRLTYAPGETGTIQVEFDLNNLAGKVEKAIFVFLEDDPDSRPSITLMVRLHIPLIVAVEPKSLIWPIDGNADTKTIHIRINHTHPVHVTAVGCSSDQYAHRLRTVEKGKHYEIDVTPRDTRGMTLGVLRIETDCDIPRYSIQQVFAVCRRPNPGETQVQP